MLTAEAEKLLASYTPEYRRKAVAAVEEGKAFCPACCLAGHSNCGSFDECGAFIMPDGSAAHEPRPTPPEAQ